MESAGQTINVAKIERLQTAGLAPRPLFHRSEELAGAELWPEGSLEHYLTVAPLIRQRHDATELAAVTMIGFGFPIDVDLLHESYAKVLPTIRDPVGWSDAMLDHYQNRGMPIVKTAIAHLRSHGIQSEDATAENLAGTFFDGLFAFSRGAASREQIRSLLAAVLPKYGQAPTEVIDLIIILYERLQKEISLPKLLETANGATVEELLSVQPLATIEVEDDLNRFGSVELSCQMCGEWRGLIVGASLPFYLRIQQMDLDELLPDSIVPRRYGICYSTPISR